MKRKDTEWSHINTSGIINYAAKCSLIYLLESLRYALNIQHQNAVSGEIHLSVKVIRIYKKKLLK
jgi:hypothetical protein